MTAPRCEYCGGLANAFFRVRERDSDRWACSKCLDLISEPCPTCLGAGRVPIGWAALVRKSLTMTGEHIEAAGDYLKLKEGQSDGDNRRGRKDGLLHRIRRWMGARDAQRDSGGREEVPSQSGGTSAASSGGERTEEEAEAPRT